VVVVGIVSHPQRRNIDTHTVREGEREREIMWVEEKRGDSTPVVVRSTTSIGVEWMYNTHLLEQEKEVKAERKK